MKRFAVVLVAILLCVGLFVSFGSEPLAGNRNKTTIELYSCGEKIGEWEPKRNSIKQTAIRTCFNDAETGLGMELLGGATIITGYRGLK